MRLLGLLSLLSLEECVGSEFNLFRNEVIECGGIGEEDDEEDALLGLWASEGSELDTGVEEAGWKAAGIMVTPIFELVSFFLEKILLEVYAYIYICIQGY